MLSKGIRTIWKWTNRKAHLGGVGEQEADRAAAWIVAATQHWYADVTLVIGPKDFDRSILQQTGRNIKG